MTSFEILRPYLPSAWVSALNSLPQNERDAIQEVRLRADEPVRVSSPDGDHILYMSSCYALHRGEALVCDIDQLHKCFLGFCENSVYAHEQELRQGFIAVRGGIRVGVAGTAVLGDDGVRSVRQVTSLCIRLPRRHTGCAASLMPFIYSAGNVYSTLLVGEPSSGKTSLLRDVAATLAAHSVRVAVVDERCELGGVTGLRGCDVLRGYPKPIGILQAVRCLAPQAIVFDELGDDAEVDAVCACAHAGVAVVASLHGRTPDELLKKSAVRRLVARGVFDGWVFLHGRDTPGRWRTCVCPEVADGDIYWRSVDRGGGDRSWDNGYPSLTLTSGVSLSR